MKRQRVVFHEFGDPVDRLELEDCAVATPNSGEILIRLLHAPINPADFNYVEGTYGLKPKSFPAPAGMEGSGEVLQVGQEVHDIHVGDRVAVLSGAGCWQQQQVLDRDQVFVLPSELDPEQGAMLKVNPPTAWIMLHRYGKPTAGSMVIQNLGNSSVGLAVIGLGRRFGLEVVSLVRSEQGREQCVAAGAAANRVFLDSKEGLEQAKEVLGKLRGSLGFNGVGGDSALRVMNLLGEQATMLTYGAMGRKPLKVPTGLLLFKGLRLEGFWLTRWIREHSSEEYHEVLSAVAEAMLAGEIMLPVAARFPFTEIKAALGRVRDGSLGGKVLLNFREL